MTRTDAEQDDITDLQTRVTALETWRTHHTDLVDELLNGTGDDPDAGEHDGPSAVDPQQLVDWVNFAITSMIARPLRGELSWCPRWPEHPEAIFRFEALRRAWLDLAGEPGTGMSTWIRDHLDPCLRELLSPTGPFADCTHNDRYLALNGHTPVPTLAQHPTGD